MTARILIVDDEAPARVRLTTLLADIAADFPSEVVGEAADGREAILALTEYQPDIVLLDVQMPGLTGIEVARHLSRQPSAPAVIFVTAFDEYALKAFEVHALDYLMKPVRATRLLDALRRAMKQVGKQGAAIVAVARETQPSGREYLSVHERGRVLLVPVADILYFKAELKYVTMRTAEREYLTEESLIGLEEEFAAQFVRVHRNALVSRRAIVGFERVDASAEGDAGGDPHWEVSLRGIDERLPVSRRQWPVIKALIKP